METTPPPRRGRRPFRSCTAAPKLTLLQILAGYCVDVCSNSCSCWGSARPHPIQGDMPETSTSTLQRRYNSPRAWTAPAWPRPDPGPIRPRGPRRRPYASLGYTPAAGSTVAHKRTANKPRKHSKREAKKHHHNRTGAKRWSSARSRAAPGRRRSCGVRPRRPPPRTGSATTTSASVSGTSRPASPSGSTAPGTVLFNGSAISSWWLNQSAATTGSRASPTPEAPATTCSSSRPITRTWRR